MGPSPIPPNKLDDSGWMRLALAEAEEAGRVGEVPIGAVVVAQEALVGRGNNRTRRDHIVHAHAELVALADAQRKQQDYRLDDDACIYVTVEPCLMCLGAILQSRIRRVVYGASEPKFGALGGCFDLRGHASLRKLELVPGLLADEASALLSDFFAALRERQPSGGQQ